MWHRFDGGFREWRVHRYGPKAPVLLEERWLPEYEDGGVDVEAASDPEVVLTFNGIDTPREQLAELGDEWRGEVDAIEAAVRAEMARGGS